MSSFDSFQEPRGARAYHDPLADTDGGAVEIEGLEPGDRGLSEDLGGIEDAVTAEAPLTDEVGHAGQAWPDPDVVPTEGDGPPEGGLTDQTETLADDEPMPPPPHRLTGGSGGSGGGGW